MVPIELKLKRCGKWVDHWLQRGDHRSGGRSGNQLSVEVIGVGVWGQ